MKPLTVCDECKFEFVLEELEIEESTLVRAGKVERIIVQYFRCPKCKHKYIICVFDDALNELNKKYKEFLQTDREGTSKAKFAAKDKIWKNRINAEASMLIHLYNKQHKESRN